MRRPTSALIALLIASTSLTTACVLEEEDGEEEDLGDIGDGKSDSFGIVDKAFTLSANRTRRFTFAANAAFRISLTQPTTAETSRQPIEFTVTLLDGTKQKVPAAKEPELVLEGGSGTFAVSVKNKGSASAKLVLNVRPLGGFGDLPNPNATQFPDVAWQPPALDQWPSSYVIFNNPGCGRTCTGADSSAQASRSVMIKMLVAAIKNVKDNGVVRVSNYNISASNSAKPVVDALLWAMQTKHATVKIVMDEAQNNAMSKTTWLSQNGAQVRFLDGLHYTNSVGDAVGIMHSKIVAVDDQVVLTGSNNFSSTGFIINEENSVVLRGAANQNRINSFICDIDKMFDIGVPAGQPQKTDDQRKTQILALDQCNGTDVWFPPTGVLAGQDSITYKNVLAGIAAAQKSIAIAPDMMAHPGLVSALISRAKKAKTAGTPFSIKLVLDASDEALNNPAFGDCLVEGGKKYGLDIQARYWHGTPDAFQLMHHKFMVIDGDAPQGATLFNGSANYSAKALKWSFENVTRYPGTQYRQLVDAFTARFAKLFADSKDKAGMAADGLTVPNCPLSINSL